MLARVAAAKASFEMILFSHYKKALIIIIKIFTLNQLLFQVITVLIVRLILPGSFY